MNKVRVIKNGKELIIRKAVKEDSAKIIEHMSFIGGESDNLTFGANEWNMTLEMEEQFIETINKKGNFKLGGLLCLNLMC